MGAVESQTSPKHIVQVAHLPVTLSSLSRYNCSKAPSSPSYEMARRWVQLLALKADRAESCLLHGQAISF